jgi:hypothetical protein
MRITWKISCQVAVAGIVAIGLLATAAQAAEPAKNKLALLSVKKAPPAATLIHRVKSCEQVCDDGKTVTGTCTSTQACCGDAAACKVWCSDSGGC